MAKAKPRKPAKKAMDTLVVFILDKSGSMMSCKDATISGFNEYINTLKKDKKISYSMSFTLFDTLFTERYTNEPLKAVEELSTKNYVPDGMTAMYDAIGHTLSATEKTLKKEQKVLCVIMTDGQENSSKEYTDKGIKDVIAKLEKTGKWSFVFLGANQDSWLVGQKFGLAAMNVADFNATGAGVQATMQTMATNTAFFAQSASAQTRGYFSKEDQDNLGKTK